MSDTSLEFISRQLQRLVTEVATLREDGMVTAAILRRVDQSMASLIEEVRGLHVVQQR